MAAPLASIVVLAEAIGAPGSSGASVIGGGCDWIGVTAPEGPPAWDLWRAGCAILDRQREAGDEPKATRQNGYHGLAAEGVFVGRREDGAYVRLSGAQANMHWRDVLVHAHNVPRFDLQVTVEAGEDCDELAVVHAAEAWNAPARRGRPPKVQLVACNDGSQTVYIGSRQSASYGRCYSKSHQKPEEYGPGCWRYEVEYHDEAAGQLAARLANAQEPTRAGAGVVHEWFSTRGIAPIFDRPTGAVPATVERPVTSTARTLKWLERCVAPSVARMAERGYSREALDAITTCLGAASDRKKAAAVAGAWYVQARATHEVELLTASGGQQHGPGSKQATHLPLSLPVVTRDAWVAAGGLSETLGGYPFYGGAVGNGAP